MVHPSDWSCFLAWSGVRFIPASFARRTTSGMRLSGNALGLPGLFPALVAGRGAGAFPAGGAARGATLAWPGEGSASVVDPSAFTTQLGDDPPRRRTDCE